MNSEKEKTRLISIMEMVINTLKEEDVEIIENNGFVNVVTKETGEEQEWITRVATGEMKVKLDLTILNHKRHIGVIE